MKMPLAYLVRLGCLLVLVGVGCAKPTPPSTETRPALNLEALSLDAQTFRLTIRDPWTDQAPQFVQVEGQDLNVVVSAGDLTWLELPQVTTSAAGTWDLRLSQPHPGDCDALIRFQTTAEASPRQEVVALVRGSLIANRSLDQTQAQTQVWQGQTVRLSTPAKVQAGRATELTVSGLAQGQPVQLVVIAASGPNQRPAWVQGWTRSSSAAGDITLTGSFPQPGFYKLWLVAPPGSGLAAAGFLLKVGE